LQEIFIPITTHMSDNLFMKLQEISGNILFFRMTHMSDNFPRTTTHM
jgi:hypothetical protein